ncbi:MAG: hypothetical protein V1708_06460 [Candidatus Micrarchaeota archaeon]
MSGEMGFDAWFAVLSFVFFGMLTLYAARTYLFFRESSLARHLKMISGGLMLFSAHKGVQLYEAISGQPIYQVSNIVEIVGALFILFGLLDFRKEFMKFRWLKEMEDEIRSEKKKAVV